MATLADITAGQQFLFVCQATSVDPTNGIALSLYGPSQVLAASATIAIDGSMTGQLQAEPASIPVTIVTGFAPFAVGDVITKDDTGETMVCRWSSINNDGSVVWSASLTHEVIYSSVGWTMIGHIDLSS